MKGIMISTDKEHLHFQNEIFPALRVPGTDLLQVSEGMEGFYGFGVAITPSSCYELSRMEPEARKKLLEHLYGKAGIGLSVGRVCVASCDYSPEIYSYDDVPFDTALEHFSIDRDKNYIIPMLKEILEINPDLYLLASPWSPPFWMKTGGSMCGGYMRNEFLDCYGDYFVKFIKAYAEEGIRIAAVTPQNEPNNLQGGHMPACIWHPETEAAFIGILRRKFAENGLDVRIWMYDQAFNDVGRVQWSLQNCSGLLENCDGVAFHYYNGTVEQTLKIRREFPQLELHLTEGGPRLTDNYTDDWCKWGTIAARILKAGYRSLIGWNLMLDECGGPHIGPFMGICGGLVTNDHRTGELHFSGQYQAFSHMAPYITPDSVIRMVSMGESFGLPVG
ncbi:MAG: hypothetical protein IJD13_07500, partial [Oscillospiraceae bacterium]|nr:hypothetical protein [Oscillospiraceae bacterium]